MLLDGEPTVAFDPIEEATPRGAQLATQRRDDPGAAPTLIVRNGAAAGQHFVIAKPRVTIGRGDASDVFLDDVTVSRHHAVITCSGKDYQIQDLGSLNGTYIERKRVDRVLLHHLDQIRIGRFALRFVLPRALAL